MSCRCPLLAASFAALCALPAHAGDKVDCENATSTYEMNICAERDLEKADAALNATYAKVLAKIAASNQEKPYDAKSWEEALRKSQRAWIAFRDADCKDLVPMAWTGGSGTTADVLGCLIEKTEARTQELEQRFRADD